MRILVTGSSGHLGKTLARTRHAQGHEVVGLDVMAGPFARQFGSRDGRAAEAFTHGPNPVA